MGRKTPRILAFIVACSAMGVILGGTASQAEINECQQAPLPSNECLSQNPLYKIVEGMSVGLLAGASAGLGATFDLWKMKL